MAGKKGNQKKFSNCRGGRGKSRMMLTTQRNGSMGFSYLPLVRTIWSSLPYGDITTTVFDFVFNFVNVL